MSNSSAKAIVIFAYGLTVAYIGLSKDSRYQKAGSKFKAVYAASWTLVGLSLAADIAPEIAGPLAVLILIAVAYKNRGEIGSETAATGGSADTIGQALTSIEGF